MNLINSTQAALENLLRQSTAINEKKVRGENISAANWALLHLSVWTAEAALVKARYHLIRKRLGDPIPNTFDREEVTT